MILSAFTLIFLTFVGVSGQNCKPTVGTSGYCRENDDCLGNSQQSDCQSGLTCCQDTGASDKKCREYGKYVFREDFNGALTARIFVHNVSECSIEVVPLIVGGVKAKAKEFPHMVAIGYGDDIKGAAWMCGGSLISESFVLSAAHCSQSEGRRLLSVLRDWEKIVFRGPAKFARAGTHNLKSSDDSSFQDFIIAERINHPKYKPPARYNDIALFRLSHSVRITAYVRPACLHTTPDEFSLKKATATGWGKLNYNNNEGSEELMKVALSFIDYSKCNSSFPAEVESKTLARGVITSQLCAGELQGGKDTCQGDSGGPLQVLRNDPYCMYSIVGITSFGKFCGFKNSPAVYTRVSYFVPWIESVVWK